MCGINGFIGSNCPPTLIQEMNQKIGHRGPDANGEFLGSCISLGHVRLSIVDLATRSNQPYIKNGLVIVFNGEIYNYRQLKKELSHINFETTSDTEVILEAWRYWGTDCLQKLRGMFAFAIHNIASGDTWLVRDPFGIKPLYYHEDDCGGLYFSSEIKAIVGVLPNRFKVNQRAILASLLYVWIPEEECIWDKIKKLPKGSFLHHSTKEKRFSLEEYWRSESLLQQNLITDSNVAIASINDALTDSVEAHLTADVPVNAFLSGGLDSSLIVAMAKKHLDTMDCFTIRFSDKDNKHEAMANDAYYAQVVAKKLGVNLHQIDVKPDLASLLPKIVHHLDEPVGDSAAISTFLICEAARSAGVKVLLSGMGADEMFGGYRKHLANLYARQYRYLPEFIRKHFIERAISGLPVVSSRGGARTVRWAKRFVSFAGLPPAMAFMRSYTYYDTQELENGFIADVTPDLHQLYDQHRSTFEIAASYDRGLVDSMCFTDINRFMVSLNLMYTDKASMAASTEVRVPFIDKDVMKAAFKVSPRLKIRGGNQKHILKKVAERWLPREVIYRPKSSFTMPLRSWVRHELGDMVDDYLLSTNGLANRGILTKVFLRKLVDDERKGRQDNSQKIWHLLTLEQWFRNHAL